MLANYWVPKLAYSHGITGAMDLALFVTVLCFIAGVALFIIDKYIYKKEIVT